MFPVAYFKSIQCFSRNVFFSVLNGGHTIVPSPQHFLVLFFIDSQLCPEGPNVVRQTSYGTILFSWNEFCI